jgi:hypothetical protein
MALIVTLIVIGLIRTHSIIDATYVLTVMLNILMLRVAFSYCYVECRYVECLYTNGLAPKVCLNNI